MTPRAGWILALAATSTMAVSYVDRQALSVLAPTITAELGISNTSYGWLVSAFSIAYLVCSPFAGRFIDRVGARRGLLASVLVWSLVAGAHALVPGLAWLFTLRILLGIAESPSFPGATQTVSRALPPADRGAGFGLLFTGSSIGAMVAPPLVTWLQARYTWRGAMVLTAVVGLSWVPIWLATTSSREARRVMEGPSRSPPFRWRELLSDPAVIRAVLVVLASAPSIAFVLLWGSKVLVEGFGLAQRDVGGYLWLPPLLFDGGAVGFGALATLRERRAPSDRPHRGLLAAAAGLAVTIAALGLTRSPWATTGVMAVSLAGGGGLFALITADMLRRVHPSRVATAGGITAAAQSLAYIAANPMIGRAVDRSHSYSGVAVALGLWLIPGLPGVDRVDAGAKDRAGRA